MELKDIFFKVLAPLHLLNIKGIVKEESSNHGMLIWRINYLYLLDQKEVHVYFDPIHCHPSHLISLVGLICGYFLCCLLHTRISRVYKPYFLDLVQPIYFVSSILAQLTTLIAFHQHCQVCTFGGFLPDHYLVPIPWFSKKFQLEVIFQAPLNGGFW